jgi:hypothetical protein
LTRHKWKERRQVPRVNQQLPVKITTDGYDFVTSTQNVSCLGAYCSINRYIPPFTKVLIKMALPISTREGNKNCDVECKGVIVRTEDKSYNCFNIAIFFNKINESERQKISQYLNQFLLQNTLQP